MSNQKYNKKYIFFIRKNNKINIKYLKKQNTIKTYIHQTLIYMKPLAPRTFTFKDCHTLICSNFDQRKEKN